MAGLEKEIAVRPGKGVMTIMNTRQVDTVVNRCKPKGDADIVVPHETTAFWAPRTSRSTTPRTTPKNSGRSI